MYIFTLRNVAGAATVRQPKTVEPSKPPPKGYAKLVIMWIMWGSGERQTFFTRERSTMRQPTKNPAKADTAF